MLIVEIYERIIASTVFFVKYFLQFISKNTFLFWIASQDFVARNDNFFCHYEER